MAELRADSAVEPGPEPQAPQVLVLEQAQGLPVGVAEPPVPREPELPLLARVPRGQPEPEPERAQAEEPQEVRVPLVQQVPRGQQVQAAPDTPL